MIFSHVHGFAEYIRLPHHIPNFFPPAYEIEGFYFFYKYLLENFSKINKNPGFYTREERNAGKFGKRVLGKGAATEYVNIFIIRQLVEKMVSIKI